jgi:DNA polymerase V
MNRPIFALIDCNNFFVSCERIFRPDLEGKPVVVLSSNDGVVVARSNEAKAASIPMAAPVFKYRELLKRHNVIQFSANFDLYGDISRRITDLLTTITPRTEVYSVDESFLDLSQLDIRDYTTWGHNLRQAIWQWTGIPVSIGIAPSKTLAKLASERAKKLDVGHSTIDDRNANSNVYHPTSNVYAPGVFNLMGQSSAIINSVLQSTPVGDVWGIGWRLAPKMRAEGVGNAYQFSKLRPQRAQQLMGIHGRQLIAELNGISCYPLELEHQKCKSISRTRTFGEDTSEGHVLEAAIASFAAQAAFRLRRSGQMARQAGIFVTTNKHKPGYRRWSREKFYQAPTADTGQLISDLIGLLGEVYSPSQSYHRAGVLLYDFVPAERLQTDLLGYIDTEAHDLATARMKAVDAINERFGKRTIRHAAELLAQTWKPKYQTRSPRYTTHFNELPNARILTKVP